MESAVYRICNLAIETAMDLGIEAAEAGLLEEAPEPIRRLRLARDLLLLAYARMNYELKKEG